MIRKKTRTKKQREHADFKRHSPSGWGHDPHDERYAAYRKALAAHIARVRVQVFDRDSACRVTGLRSVFDQMHEWPSRAKTRGLPMEQRFNLRVCVRLNSSIHRMVTENKLVVVPEDPARGFNGPIRAYWKATGEPYRKDQRCPK